MKSSELTNTRKKYMTRLTLVVLLLVLAACFFFYVKKTNSKLPNIVFITLDTTRADRIGIYGNKDIETPNIDNLAKKGVLFEQAFVNVPITLPSHCSIFTGLSPLEHGVRENGTFQLDESALTLAEILEEKGYSTAAFVSGFPLDSRFGLNQGFQFYDDDFSSQGPSTQEFRWQGHTARAFERNANSVVTSAISWLASNAQDSFFMWLHFFDPHTGYNPPSPFRERYKNHLYDGEIAFVDDQLGYFLDALTTLGLSKETIFIIVGDHGESLGEHNIGSLENGAHGMRLYDPGIHVPLIMSWPSILPKGKKISNLVRSIDIFPTLLEMLEIEQPPTSGRSMLNLMLTGSRESVIDGIYCETLFPLLRFKQPEVWAYRTEEWKFIRYVINNSTVGFELFNLKEDPKELNNRASTEPEKLKYYTSLLDKKIYDLEAAGLNRANAVSMDEETLDKLRSLGYMK